MDPEILLVVPPLMLAIIVHEVAHGVAANKLGDATAYMLGRITLNPLAHIDMVGTIVFPALQLLTTGRVFIAWAKPVPIQMRNLKNPLRDFAFIAIAGPLSNLAQAVLWAIPFWLFTYTDTGSLADALLRMSIAGLQINLALMTFNMLPIPPLDGSRVVAALLPPALAMRYLSIERYSFMILILLLVGFRGALHSILVPVISFFQSLLLPGSLF